MGETKNFKNNISNDKIKLMKIQDLKKFYINASNVYLDVVKQTGVAIYYETRLKEYKESLDFLNNMEKSLLTKIQQQETISKIDFSKIDVNLIELNKKDIIDIENKTTEIISNLGFDNQRVFIFNKLEKMKKIEKLTKLENFLDVKSDDAKKTVALTEEEKDEYRLLLDRLSKDGELDLPQDEYQVILDKLTREGEEITEIQLKDNDSRETSSKSKKKSKLLADIEEVYAEELNKIN